MFYGDGTCCLMRVKCDKKTCKITLRIFKQGTSKFFF